VVGPVKYAMPARSQALKPNMHFDYTDWNRFCHRKRGAAGLRFREVLGSTKDIWKGQRKAGPCCLCSLADGFSDKLKGRRAMWFFLFNSKRHP
jgi:hypothetical protein